MYIKNKPFFVTYVFDFFLLFLIRVDKKRDKLERKVLDSQERAFWDVHRPVVSLRHADDEKAFKC